MSLYASALIPPKMREARCSPKLPGASLLRAGGLSCALEIPLCPGGVTLQRLQFDLAGDAISFPLKPFFPIRCGLWGWRRRISVLQPTGEEVPAHQSFPGIVTPGSFRTASVSRRRVLSLAAGVRGAPRLASLAARIGAGHARGVAAAACNAAAVAEHAGRRRLATVLAPWSRALVAAMQAHQVPGAAIGLLAGGPRGARHGRPRQPLVDASGHPHRFFRSAPSPRPTPPQSSGCCIDEGSLLALDKPVRTWIPNLDARWTREVAAKLTIGNLLDHSAGFYGDEGFRHRRR